MHTSIIQCIRVLYYAYEYLKKNEYTFTFEPAIPTLSIFFVQTHFFKHRTVTPFLTGKPSSRTRTATPRPMRLRWRLRPAPSSSSTRTRSTGARPTQATPRAERSSSRTSPAATRRSRAAESATSALLRLLLRPLRLLLRIRLILIPPTHPAVARRRRAPPRAACSCSNLQFCTDL